MSMDLKEKRDPRELPAYGISEVARYLLIPETTLRYWIFGQRYKTKTGKRLAQSIIDTPPNDKRFLSFFNLGEAHILDAIRREHDIPLQEVRKALNYLSENFKSEHPLVEQKFETDGLDLFIRKYGQLINLTQNGQIDMKDVLKAYLHRIERDTHGVPIRLFPFTRKRELDEPRIVVIDPYIPFGRPILVGTGITTAIVAERYKERDIKRGQGGSPGCWTLAGELGIGELES